MEPLAWKVRQPWRAYLSPRFLWRLHRTRRARNRLHAKGTS